MLIINLSISYYLTCMEISIVDDVYITEAYSLLPLLVDALS